MNTILKTVIISFILVSPGMASASFISPETAWHRMADRSNKVYSFKNGVPKLEYTLSKAGVPTLYLFNSDGHTFCVSADDEVPALLGYADKTYSMRDVSPAFEAWLNTMAEEIGRVREGSASRNEMETRSNDFASIAPLCKTQWNQDAPYNNVCPKPKGETQRAYTGCVATAMAQVMKYHNWPLTGEGEISYNWNNLTLHEDFSTTSFDWKNMLDIYTEGEYSEEEGIAVARLMRSCGIGVEMSYSTSGSGALSQLIGGALGKYFKYDKSRLRYLMRDFFSLDEWEEMIYGSLQNDGPVILDGQSNQGGHSFVCDGYDKDGYFHINWGWGGTSDGYYLLSVLDPYNQGIGGSGDNSGFNYMQDAIIGIVPAKDDNSNNSWIGQLYSMGPLDIDTSVNYTPGEVIGPFCNDGIYNFGPAALPVNTELGLLFSNEVTGEKYIDYGVFEEGCGVMYGFSGVSLPVPMGITDGTYRVTLSYRAPQEDADEADEPRPDSEGWLNVYFPIGETASYIANVSEGIVTVEDSSWRPSGVEETYLLPADDSPRYFNLQGIEIKAPRKGELVIQKRGKEVKKIFI